MPILQVCRCTWGSSTPEASVYTILTTFSRVMNWDVKHAEEHRLRGRVPCSVLD